MTGAIGLGDTYHRLQEQDVGHAEVRHDVPPVQDLDRPAESVRGQLGNYNTVMGNTGGDNRIEFGTRFDHAIIYNSPTMQGFSFDLCIALGQNVTYNNVTTPLGSPDCTGGNSRAAAICF